MAPRWMPASSRSARSMAPRWPRSKDWPGLPEAGGPRLDALQTAFLEAGGAQCGICTPGMLMAGRAYLDGGGGPDEDAIRDAIAGNLCRCTGYTKIIEAIALAASTGRPLATRVSPGTAADPDRCPDRRRPSAAPDQRPGSDRRRGRPCAGSRRVAGPPRRSDSAPSTSLLAQAARRRLRDPRLDRRRSRQRTAPAAPAAKPDAGRAARRDAS